MPSKKKLSDAERRAYQALARAAARLREIQKQQGDKKRREVAQCT